MCQQGVNREGRPLQLGMQGRSCYDLQATPSRPGMQEDGARLSRDAAGSDPGRVGQVAGPDSHTGYLVAGLTLCLAPQEATSRIPAEVGGNRLASRKLALAALGRGNWRDQQCTLGDPFEVMAVMWFKICS